MVLKRLRDPVAADRHPRELEELLDLTVWNYHGTPHAGLGGLTPLEMMRRHAGSHWRCSWEARSVIRNIHRISLTYAASNAPIRTVIQPGLGPVAVGMRGEGRGAGEEVVRFGHLLIDIADSGYLALKSQQGGKDVCLCRAPASSTFAFAHLVGRNIWGAEQLPYACDGGAHGRGRVWDVLKDSRGIQLTCVV